MATKRILGIALAAVGVVLLILGLQGSGVFSEQVRQQVTGQYSDRTTWYIVAGVAGIIIGGGVAFWKGHPRLPHGRP